MSIWTVRTLVIFCKYPHDPCHQCTCYEALFACIGFYFLIFFSFSPYSNSLYKWTVSPIHLDCSRGKRASQRSRGERGHRGGHWDQRPTQCSTHNWSWISVHISWLFTKWWLLTRTKYMAWQYVWSKLECFGCGKIWGQNWNPVLLPWLKPVRIVSHCGFWDSKKRWIQVIYYTSFRGSWAFNSSHQVGFWWVKCKWNRNIRIKFPLQYTWVLNEGEKVLEAQCIYLPNLQTFKK